MSFTTGTSTATPNLGTPANIKISETVNLKKFEQIIEKTMNNQTDKKEPSFDKALKFDAGKPQMSLLPADALESLGAVAAYGAKKYGVGNWLKNGGMEWRRLYDAAFRHLLAFAKGEVNDPESGLPHMSHAAWNFSFDSFAL
jgi:hypothetical protein